MRKDLSHLRNAVLLAFLVVSMASIAAAQPDSVATLKARGQLLMDAQKLTEALPIYEGLILQAPNDPDILRNLGFALLGKAITVEDPAEKKGLRIRARDSFIAAKKAGDTSISLAGLIEGIPPDGSLARGFSDNAEANKLMENGEGFFATGKMDEAFKAYTDALKLDPRCYHAALFAADVKMHTEQYNEAEKWYQKAISIDPNIETAYRYSATPLMKQGKTDLARDRYIEAFITDPYNKMAVSGIVGWAEVTKTNAGHPKIDIPKMETGPDGKVNTTININPLSEDGSLAWASYVATRDIWKQVKFPSQFPKETAYRHSLPEEADALRSVVLAAKALKPKTMNQQIALISQMEKDGVLEAFVLLAIPDQGIASDHRAFLIAHRDKLRLYVVKYVLGQVK